MTHNYEQVCWNCGSKDMETDALGVKCRTCGATWNRCPRPAAPIMSGSYIHVGSSDNPVIVHTGRPTKSAVCHIAKARQQALDDTRPENAAGQP